MNRPTLMVRLLPAALLLASLLPGAAGDVALVVAVGAGWVGTIVLAVLAWRRRVSVLEPVLALAGVAVVLADRGLAVAAAVLLAAALARAPERPGSPVQGDVPNPAGDDGTPIGRR